MRGIPPNVLAGYALLTVLWAVILVPSVAGVVRFVRTTRLPDLVPRIRIVRRSP